MVTLLGWIGALLALVAYAQTGAARLRQIALLSSVALLSFNAILGIWSNVVLEFALFIVNVRRLWQLRTEERTLQVSRVRRAARPRPNRRPAGRAPAGRTIDPVQPVAG